MTEDQKSLLLTTARILRAHLKDTADTSPVNYDAIIQDVRDMNLALRPFESNVTALHPNTAEKSLAEHVTDICARDRDPLR